MSDRHAAVATWNISTLLRLILFLDPKFSTEVSEFISHWMASPVLLSQQWRHRRSLVSDWLASAAGEAWYHSCNRVREYADRTHSSRCHGQGPPRVPQSLLQDTTNLQHEHWMLVSGWSKRSTSPYCVLQEKGMRPRSRTSKQTL